MPKTDRHRPLYVLKYLWEHTDEDHPATLAKIQDYLSEQGIDANPRTIIHGFAKRIVIALQKLQKVGHLRIGLRLFLWVDVTVPKVNERSFHLLYSSKYFLYSVSCLKTCMISGSISSFDLPTQQSMSKLVLEPKSRRKA